MKKYISTFIIIAMVLSMVACGSDKEIPTPDEIEGGTTKLSDNVKPIQNNDDQELEDYTSEDLNDSVEEKIAEKKESNNTQEIGLDFDKDIEAGLLYIDSNTGQVVDKNGNLVEAYSYITLTPDRTLVSEGDIMDGYAVDDNFKIIFDEEYITMAENYEAPSTSYMDTLLAIADQSKAGQKVPFDEEESSDTVVRLADNGGPYYSDIILGNWWPNGVNGMYTTAETGGRTVMFPKSISWDMDKVNVVSGALDNFRLIDQDTCKIEDIKRSGADEFTTYAFYLQNIEKYVDDYGNMYFTGFVDTDYVAVWGEFDSIMNGDNLFVYAAYDGLSLNDVPTFKSPYVEIIN